MKTIQVRIPEEEIKKLESRKEFKSISQAIRKAIEEFNRKPSLENKVDEILDRLYDLSEVINRKLR